MRMNTKASPHGTGVLLDKLKDAADVIAALNALDQHHPRHTRRMRTLNHRVAIVVVSIAI